MYLQEVLMNHGTCLKLSSIMDWSVATKRTKCTRTAAHCARNWSTCESQVLAPPYTLNGLCLLQPHQRLRAGCIMLHLSAGDLTSSFALLPKMSWTFSRPLSMTLALTVMRSIV